MALEAYNAKRDTDRTAEPKGTVPKKRGNSFVIQKHAARRLHYDFRLEMDGVLKSWAVTRGPSLIAGEKRLAVHVEDHPLDYGGFEGNIPKGEYGGGSVIVWDRGHWQPVGDVEKSYAKGHMEFDLDGEKLRGRWHLVRMGNKTGEKRENWLLIKSDDEAARAAEADDILEEMPNSVLTGRPVEDLAGEAPGWSSKTGRIDKKKAAPHKKKSVDTAAAEEADVGEPLPDVSTIGKSRKGPLPDFIPPQLASLTAKPPAGKRWLHEVKFDGYRLQVRVQAGRVKFLTRTGLDWTKKFGKELISAFQSLPVATAIFDGELVVENDAGSSDFSALQSDLSDDRSDRFVFYAFDLLYLDGIDLTRAALVERKTALEKLLSGQSSKVRYSSHFEDEGGLVLEHACRLSLEGIISKVSDAPYRSGRSKDWQKSKCTARQEFVVGGYVPSTASRRAIGSLVMGAYQDGKLVHVGRVGTGYSAKIAEELFGTLEKIRMDKSPFHEKLTAEEGRQVRFCQPKLVAEVEFRAWTADHHLRHASFRGLREDKPAKEIVLETTPPPSGKTATAKPQKRTVKLSHPDRIYWPDQGVTKEGLADYYAEVWPQIAPFITGRPLSLLRCPEGITGQSFFQKHAWKGMNAKIRQIGDPADPDGDALIAIDDLDGLISLVQGAALEIHPWGSTIKDIERPDMIIMDLDPGEDVPWTEVIAGAFEVKQRLEDVGLVAFVKTSGGKGLHVVSPLKPGAEWPKVKDFTKSIAEAMSRDAPDAFVATVTKSKRHGKILVDYLRNGRGATAVAPYSSRARKGAPVSMPLAWDELNEAIGAAYFTVTNAPARLAKLSKNPWDGFRSAAAPLDFKAAPKRKSKG